MRTTLRYFAPLFAAAGAAAAILAAPAAGADPSLVPQCVNTGGSAALGGSSTLCETPGNAQLNATPPVYAGPWGDMWGYGGAGYYFP